MKASSYHPLLDLTERAKDGLMHIRRTGTYVTSLFAFQLCCNIFQAWKDKGFKYQVPENEP